MASLGGDLLTRTQNYTGTLANGNPMAQSWQSQMQAQGQDPNASSDGSMNSNNSSMGYQAPSIYNQYGGSSSSSSSGGGGTAVNNWPQPNYQQPPAYQAPTYQAPGAYQQPAAYQQQPAYQDPAQQAQGQYQTSVVNGGPIQNSIGNNQLNTSYVNPSQSAVHSVGGSQDYSGPAGDALYKQAQSRLDPQWGQRQQDLEAQLANMGLSRGTEAWTREAQNMGMQRNDAYNQAIWSAQQAQAQEANRLQGMDINSGNFANAATQQDYTNQLASQQAQNAALGQEFGQGLQQGQFANAAQAQGFGQNLSQAQLNNAGLQAAQANDIARSGLATQRYNTDVGANTARYGTDVGSATQRYGTDVGANSARYNTDVGANTARYGTDVGAAASRYGADSSSAASRYGADQGLAASQYNAQSSAANAGASAAAARYAADMQNQQWNKQFGANEDQRAIGNTYTAQRNPIELMNLLNQGVTQPTQPTFNQFAQTGAPTTNNADYARQIQAANTQGNASINNAAGGVTDALSQLLARNNIGSFGGYSLGNLAAG